MKSTPPALEVPFFVTGLIPDYWLPLLLLFTTLSLVLISACLVMTNVKRPTDIDAAPATTSDEQVFFHYIFNDVNTLTISQFSEYITNMAKTYNNLKFKIFFLKDDIHNSYRLQLFSDVWSFMGLNDGVVDITPDNAKAIQELQSNHSNVKIFIKRLSNYAVDKCWKHKLRQVQPMNVPFFLRLYSVWRFGGIAMDLPAYNQLHRFRLTDHHTGNRANQILNDFNHKAIGHEQNTQVLKFDLTLFDFLSKYFVEMARMNYMPLQIGEDNKSSDKNGKTTESIIQSNSGNGLEKRSVETTTQYKIAPKHKITDVENHAGVTSNSAAITNLEDVNNINSTKERNDTNMNNNEGKIILALIRSSSYVAPPILDDDDQISTGQFRDDVYIDLTGKFIAADRAHHPFIENILATSANVSPVKAITSVLTAKCGGNFKCPYCKTVFYF